MVIIGVNLYTTYDTQHLARDIQQNSRNPHVSIYMTVISNMSYIQKTNGMTRISQESTYVRLDVVNEASFSSQFYTVVE